MPELPDLIYIEKHLRPRILGRTIQTVEVVDPVVLRLMLDGRVEDLLVEHAIREVQRKGPFLVVHLSDGLFLVVHFMLTGRFALVERGSSGRRKAGIRCFSLGLGDLILDYLDDKKMGKVYICHERHLPQIPGLQISAPDVLGPAFTASYFLSAMGRSRRQVRAFLLDHSLINVVGNAYADEILFDAGIHPKRSCSSLTDGEKDRLFHSIRSVMEWGIQAVENRGAAIEVKVRDHVRVRNRKDQPCPVCGAAIRRANVLGYDAFYCPKCQPWEKDLFGTLPG